MKMEFRGRHIPNWFGLLMVAAILSTLVTGAVWALYRDAPSFAVGVLVMWAVSGIKLEWREDERPF